MPSSARLTATAVFVGCLALYLVDVLYGPWNGNGGFFLVQSSLLADGLRPYLDFQPFYPPLIAALHAPLVGLGLDRWMLAIGIPLLWVVGIGVLTLAALRQDVPRLSGWALGLTLGAYALFSLDNVGNHMTLEHGVVASGLLAVVTFRSAERPGALQFFAAGMFAACAGLSKQSGMVLVLPFLTQVRGWREAAALVVGWLQPWLALSMLWALGPADLATSFASVPRYASYFNGELASNGANGVAKLLERAYNILRWEYKRSPVCLVGMGLVALGGVAAVRRTSDWRQRAWLGAWMVVAAATLGSRVLMDFYHYTLNVWPALVVLAGASLRQAPGAALRAAVTIGACSAVALVLGTRHLNPAYTHRWQASVLMDHIKPVASELAALSPNDRWVYNASVDMMVLFLADKLPINKDWTLFEDFLRLAAIPRATPDARRVPIILNPDLYASRHLVPELRLSPHYHMARRWKVDTATVELWMPH
jgi:hypothetical protein